MAYRLRRDETLDHGVERITHELADDALDLLGDPSPGRLAETAHEARKLCKKGRGLARLVRPALGDRYGKTNRAFRDAGRALAPIRDPQSMIGIFDDLVASAGPMIPEHGFRGVRLVLAGRAEEAVSHVIRGDDRPLRSARDLIVSARASTRAWAIPDEVGPVSGGISKTYRRGRKRSVDARDHRTPESFHEWRKRVKYLWYQVRLVGDSAPSVLGPLANSFHDLSDALGDAHDLALLSADLRDTGTIDAPEQERRELAMLADGRRGDLEDRALRLGRRLYVEKPKRFAARVEGYWGAWQAAPELPAGEIADLFPPDDEGAR